jgi:hypothetical protein
MELASRTTASVSRRFLILQTGKKVDLAGAVEQAAGRRI